MPEQNDHNSRKNERSIAAMFEVWGRSVAQLMHIAGPSWRGQVEFRGMTIRPPQRDKPEWLVVMKGWDDAGAPVVAYHSASTGPDAIAGAIERFSEGTLTWKEDKYYGN